MANRKLKLLIESIVSEILHEDQASKEYLRDLNLKQLKKGKRPEDGEDPKQFFTNLQKELEPEAERGPIFDKKILDVIEAIPFKMDKKETQWVANLAKDGHDINLRKLRDVLDFARQTNTDISKYKNFDEPAADSDEWHEQFKGKEDVGDYDSGDENVVINFSNGYKIVKVPSDDLETEGNKMGHCVGDYCDMVDDGEAVIYSLRDKKNEPHVTFEWDPNFGRFEQIQGKENKEPVKKYHSFIRDFALKMGDKASAVEYGHKLTAKDYAEIIISGGLNLKNKIAEMSNTPRKILAKLALDKDSSVREHVARNPNTPPEILARLSLGSDEFISWSAVANPSTPKDALLNIVLNREGQLHRIVATNPNAPSEALAILAGSKDTTVVRLVAQHLNTPKDILIKLANDPHGDYNDALADNPNTPAEILEALVGDPNLVTRSALARNPRVSNKTLRKLANDKDDIVAHYAQQVLYARHHPGDGT